jgi:hypothetical protein
MLVRLQLPTRVHLLSAFGVATVIPTSCAATANALLVRPAAKMTRTASKAKCVVTRLVFKTRAQRAKLTLTARTPANFAS